MYMLIPPLRLQFTYTYFKNLEDANSIHTSIFTALLPASRVFFSPYLALPSQPLDEMVRIPLLQKKSKVRHRSLNLFDCVILVPKLVNRSFRSSNLFGCVILISKLINYLFRSSNLSSHVISVLKFDFESHLNLN